VRLHENYVGFTRDLSENSRKILLEPLYLGHLGIENLRDFKRDLRENLDEIRRDFRRDYVRLSEYETFCNCTSNANK